jgi:hypothetical protein
MWTRILRGEKASDRTGTREIRHPAKARGLDVPPSLLVRADEVIE